MNDTKKRVTGSNALEIHGLRKAYGTLVALDGIDLTVPKGEIFGLLGHNGAGKSTTIECALGTKQADGGTVSVLGMDPERDRKELFARVGVQFQHTGFQDKLRVGEACGIAASLYRESRDWRELLERFSLLEKCASFVSELSGGERQKLAVAIALIHGPELLFLDELTTGLDPASRRTVWDYLKALKKDGVSIVLTSHYMDEVEYLCDRVAILRKGKIVMEGTPEDLVAEHNAKNLEDVFLKEAM